MDNRFLNYRNKKVLIVGGLGFIGSNLAIALYRAGASVNLLSIDWPLDDSHISPVLKKMHFWKNNMRELHEVQRVVKDVEIIFNLAAGSGAIDSNQCPLKDLDLNCRPQLVLLEACRISNPSVKLVYTSSRLVYSPHATLPVTEGATTNPVSLYGIHKLTVEKYHQIYFHLHGINSVILRITNPYGPYQRPGRNNYGIINWFIQIALSGGNIPVYGTGEQVRDYIYIDDVVNAMMLSGINTEADNLIFNIASGNPTRFIDMVKAIISVTGKGNIQYVPWPVNASKVETGDFKADIRFIKKKLGWQPTIALIEGVEKVIAFYNESKLK